MHKQLPWKHIDEPSNPTLAQPVLLLKFGDSLIRSGEIGGSGAWRGAWSMLRRVMFGVPRSLVLSLLVMPAPAAAEVIAADGGWAALRYADHCEAVARSVRMAAKDRPQARAGFSFGGRRTGEFHVRLSRPARDGSAVMLTVGELSFLLVGRDDWAWSRGPAQDAAIIAAVRGFGGMRVQGRDAAGGRFADRYLLAGAPTAIDAAAAACAQRPAGKNR